VTVAPGATVTAAGAIQITASLPGAAASGLGGASQPVELIDILDFVLTVTMVQATSGGVDDETDQAYLNRLSEQLSLLTLTPVLAVDFAKLAKNVPPVYRAVALDNFNPADNTYTNERMVGVCCIDINGNPLSAPAKANVDAYLQSLRETNFIVNVFDPTYTIVAVTTQVHCLPGFTPASVIAEVQAALVRYLNPATWGQPIGGDTSSSPQDWTNTKVVRKYEVSQVINSVGGVDYIMTLTLGIPPAGLTEADVTLLGQVCLPTAGTMTVTTG
jgi:hypothetical protein